MPALKPCRISSWAQFAFFKVFFQQLVYGFRGGLSDFGQRVFNGGSHIGGHGDFLEILALAGVSLVFQHVYNAGELGALADGQHQRHHRGAELFTQLLDGLFIVGVFRVHTVDDEHAAYVVLLGVSPGFFSAHSQAADGAYHDRGGFHHAQGTHHFADKIKIAGNVDQVDLGALPFHGSGRGADRNAAFVFFGVKVGHGGAGFNLALTVDHARGKKHSLGEGGFALAAVTQQRDVADVFGFVISHCWFPL